MLRFFAPLSFSFILLTSTAQAMEPDLTNNNAEQNGDEAANDNFQAFFLALMRTQQATFDPYAGSPPFEKEVWKIVGSPQKSEEKKEEIIGLIARDDLNATFEEKVNSILKHFPGSMCSNASFSETQCIEISKVLAQQNPSPFFTMCVHPTCSPTGPSSVEFLDQDIKKSIIENVSNDYFEEIFNSQIDMEKRLEILSDMVRSGGAKTLTRVFNKYLDLKKDFNAPYLPTSFRVVGTNQDFIAEFYALTLAPRVPEILMNETLNLDLKGRLAFANRCKIDSMAGIKGRGGEPDYKTPQSLIDFYKFASTCKDASLTINERFNALEQLLTLSEGKEKQVILDVLQNEETAFNLRHKLSHLAKYSADQELQEKGNAFIMKHQEEIRNEAKDRYGKLSVHSRMGIPALRHVGASGKDVTVGVCDVGFFKILPPKYSSTLMNTFTNDEKSYQWKMLHEGKILAPRIFDENWLTEVKNPCLPYHGSEMSDLIVTVAPAAHVIPVAVHTNSSKSLIDAFNHLAEDINVNIISCSFMLPDESDALESEVKKSLLNCLKRNKIVVLGAGNHGAYIPDGLSEPEPFVMNASNGSGFFDIMNLQKMQDGLRVVNDLFKGEEENSPIFSNLILVGSSKANSLELHDKAVKPGNGPAQNRFVYADADQLKNFFDDEPCWGGTSAATAMVSGILADLWSQVQNPDENTAARISRALLENTDVDETIPVKTRGRGKVNVEKVLENLGQY